MLTLLAFILCLYFPACFAQELVLPIKAISLSSELSTNTEVETDFKDREIRITGGLKSENGANLFHSFDDFSVDKNYSAIFINNEEGFNPINIISRVTGGETSSIYGNLQTHGFDNVNLFLINPAGVIFGPDSTLNITGALHVITTKDIQLINNTQALLSNTDDESMLTVAQIVDFGFLNMQTPLHENSDNSDSIEIIGSNLIKNQGDLSLVGKDIILIDATLESENGSILISGESLSMLSSEGRANSIDINIETMSMVGSHFSTRTTNTQNSGNIFINARNSVKIHGVSDIGSEQESLFDVTVSTTPVLTTTLIGDGGKAGDIKIVTPNLEIAKNAGIFARALGSTGKAGNITLVTENYLVIKESSEVSTIALGEGGGNINIHSEIIVLDDDSKITASAFENGGAISINADYLFNSPDSRISAQTAGVGSSIDGLISVTAPDENIIPSTLTLSDTYLHMPNLSANPCTRRTNSNGNSLIIRKSSGIAPEPGSMLSASNSNLNEQIPPVSLQMIGETIVLSELECSTAIQQ